MHGLCRRASHHKDDYTYLYIFSYSSMYSYYQCYRYYEYLILQVSKYLYLYASEDKSHFLPLWLRYDIPLELFKIKLFHVVKRSFKRSVSL